MWKVLLTLSLLCWGLCSSAEISCRDKNGGEVDWYILYKVPKLNNVPLTGLEYFYIDATPKKMEQNDIINDPNGVLERTLKPLLNPIVPLSTTLTHSLQQDCFKGQKTLDTFPTTINLQVVPLKKNLVTVKPAASSLFYATHPCLLHPALPLLRQPRIQPLSSPFACSPLLLCPCSRQPRIQPLSLFSLKIAQKVFGHSKGIVMTDKSTGVWLLHSTPNFPYDRKHGVLWPDSGSRNAQTFICVNFEYNQFQEIGKHLQYIRAFPFDHDIPNDFHSELKSVVKREDFEPKKLFLPQELKSRGGQDFKSFAKYSSGWRDADDLYFLIAHDLKSSLSARSWEASRKHEESDCRDDWIVYIIDYVGMTLSVEKKRTKVSFTDCNDHSKWCVTEDQNNPWTCIADLNKVETQDLRPGGALCIKNAAVQEKFKNFIQTKEQCRKKRKS